MSSDSGDDQLALLDQVVDRQLAYVSSAWGQASAYETAITVAGYGAFFALWSGVSDDVTMATRAASAGLMGVSLALYISWTLLLMLGRHKYDLEYAALLQGDKNDPERFLAEWDKISKKAIRNQLSVIFRFWPWVFRTSVAFGFLGALTLVYNCIAIVTNLPQLVGF